VTIRAAFGVLCLLSGGILAAGCAEGIPPIEQLAATQGAIRAAEEAGAEHEPQAELHLKLAHEQLDKAKALMDNNDNEEASRLLQRASADADVARAYARKQTTVQAADNAQAQVDKLKKHIK
jgi:Domain of unknown function (DUF4398)